MHIYEKYRQLYNRVFVKANTVVMQMFILMFSVRNTSIYICHTLLCENFFELFVEFSADSVSVILKADINTCFNWPIIRFSAFENSGIRIADNFSVEFGYNIRVPFSVVFMRFANSSMLGTLYSNVIAVYSIYGLYIASNSSASLICAVLICNLSFTIMTSLILYDIIIIH